MKKIVAIFIVSILFPAVLLAQSETEKGDEFFSEELYNSALKEYEKILKKGSTPDELKPELHFKIGKCYQELLDYEKARVEYDQAYNLGYSDPQIYLKIGDVTLKSGEYEEAKPYLEKFLTYMPSDPDGQHKLETCEFAIRNMKKIPDYEISNEYSLNTDKNEYSATYLPSNVTLQADLEKYSEQMEVIPEFFYEKMYWADIAQTAKARLMFTSSRDEGANKNVDFAISDQIYEVLYNKRQGQWGEPKKLKGDVNSSKNNVGIMSYNHRNKTGYFQRCNSQTAKTRFCNIWFTKYDENTNTFSKAQEFGFSTREYIIGHPNLSDDARILFFASDIPGGNGGADIYYSILDENGNWGDPINAGPLINTEYDETFPFLKGDSVLYFSSKGHVGMGGDDVFYSKVDNNFNFSKPVNLGVPINSTADDFAIIFTNPMNGFFCSNREADGAIGGDDIYSFKRKPKAFLIKGNVRDKYNKNFDKLTVVLTGSDGTRFEVTTDSLGNYVFDDEKLKPGVDYEVQVIEDDYLSEKNPVNTDDDTVKDSVVETGDTVQVVDNNDIDVMKYNRDSETEIQNIYWDFDKWFLRQISKQELDRLASILNGDPTNYIILNSYADEQGTFHYNKILSHKRARTVVDYLISNGVDKNRLLGRGFGEAQLVVKHAKNDADHQLNRRTTFEVKTRDEFMEYLYWAGVYSEKSKKYAKYLTYYGNLVANVDFGTSNDIEFRVQFIATREPIDDSFYRKIEQNIPNEAINYSHDPDGYYRYSVGNYIDIKQAYETQRKLKALGYDTYIVAFNNGKKISVKEAKKLLKSS